MIHTLTEEQSLRFARLDVWGRQRIVLSDSDVFERDGALTRETTGAGGRLLEIRVLPRPGDAFLRGRPPAWSRQRTEHSRCTGSPGGETDRSDGRGERATPSRKSGLPRRASRGARRDSFDRLRRRRGSRLHRRPTDCRQLLQRDSPGRSGLEGFARLVEREVRSASGSRRGGKAPWWCGNPAWPFSRR